MKSSAITYLLGAVERVAAVIFGVVTLLVVVSSIGRYLLSMPVPDSFDLSRLLLGIAIVWGFASVAWAGTHIKVDLLVEVLPENLRKYVNAFAWGVLFLFTALLVWKIWGRVWSAYGGGDATMELRLKHWPFFLAIWVGLVAALVATAARIWLILTRNTPLGEFDAVEPWEDGHGQ
ncbi:TRAP transporter small permease subunit [Rhodobacterales bacterium HKCCE2091]|nr:TRAP transporter small permease subunit [Rhodobacterales bacterium HKCCE2091]